MLWRLLLGLVLAFGALPAEAAMPACHDTMPAMAAMAGDHRPAAPAPDRMAPGHACIGCIPPGDWLAPRVAAPALPPAMAPAARIRRLEPGRRDPPASPPPRIG
jgi:hypothetical protein